ncbi:MAG: DUF1611 domain-containing protein [Leptolyngbyaceae cyanobacterium SM1_1_3]|nr:DUF1611 domain-containing protein [Leptolyngbyaceae cyanobacterium SM1_1_3]NJN03183.1 DUF1611 domain-containing protein [Leptolyngbyaceae cyanobacterium RM1_1_2]NJO08896.1 DUF1611 domain-containing protein [Leptolyngbyaceae cyanobacterium SL_1_1]
MRLSHDHHIAILLHGGTQGTKGKTGLAMLRYSPLPIVVVIDQDCAGQSLLEKTGIDRKVPIVSSVAAALTYEPTVLAIGIAPSGGAIPAAWYQEIKQAAANGLSIVNGLHTPLSKDPNLTALMQPDQWIWDVRQEPPGLTVGSGQAKHLNCLRVLTVGTDMSVGKMSTNLELYKACQLRGIKAKVIATGQTNLMLGDDGVALDAVRVDFAAGAVERLMLKYGPDYDILFVEGQGSLMNPASTATLPLLRGSQPTHLLLAHRAGQTHIHNFAEFQIPSLPEVIRVYETVASAGGTFAPTKVVGIALNTAHLSELEARVAIAQTQKDTGLPCTDTVRFGAESLLEAILCRV